METGGILEFLNLIFGSFSFTSSYGANISVLMWLLLIMIVYNAVLLFKRQLATSEKLTKLTLMLGLFGTLYCIIVAVYSVGGEGIANEMKQFELLARSAQGLIALAFSIMGWLLVSTLNFFLVKES